MSLRIIGAVLKAQAGKVAGKFRKDAPRVDEGLPLGIRIGGMVQFDTVSFILAGSGGSLVEPPSGDFTEVVAYGKIALPSDGMTMHRFYLKDEKHVLRIITDRNGNVEDGETVLFSLHSEQVPDTEEEWNAWLGDPDRPDIGFWIGYYLFELPDSDPVVQYARMIGDDSDGQIGSLSLVEYVYASPQGEGERVNRKLMPYGRCLSDTSETPEYLTVSSVEGNNEAWVEILVGIPVMPATINVL